MSKRHGTARLAAILCLTAGALLAAALPANAGTPNQTMQGTADIETHDGCGHLYVWFDDYVDFRGGGGFFNQTEVTVTGYTAVQFDWSCADVPKPQLPEVSLSEDMILLGMDPSLNLDASASGRKSAEVGVAPEFAQSGQGEMKREYQPILRWNTEGYQSRWENGYTLPGKGRNLSVEHRVTANVTFPDESNGYRNTFSLSASDEARD